MASNYSFVFRLKPKEKEKICRNCCVKIDVFFRGDKIIRKYYCLHCEKIYSRSGMYCHRLVITHPQSVVEELKASFLQNLQNHERKVKNIFEVKGVVGMRRTTLIHTPHLLSFSLPPLRIQRPSQPIRPRPRTNQSFHAS